MSVNILKLLASEIRARRKEAGFSQDEFASRIGVSTVFISKIERGLANPTVTVLEKIAAFFGLSISDLFYSVERQTSLDSLKIGILQSILGLDENQLLKVVRQITAMRSHPRPQESDGEDRDTVKS